MAAIALALGSSLVWGCADFFGGILSRRLALAGVTVVSQAAGFAALLIWLAGDGFHLETGQSTTAAYRAELDAVAATLRPHLQG